MRTEMLMALATALAASALAVSAPAQESAAGPPPPKLSDFDILTQRDPFSPEPEKEPVAPAKPPAKTPDPTPEKKRETRDEITKNLTVTGVFLPRDGGNAPVAIVEELGAKPRNLRQGDTFLAGSVTAVSMDGVTIVVDGQARVLKLGEPFADGTKTHQVYVDTGERVDGGASASAGTAATADGAGDGAAKKPGSISSLLTDAERALPPAEMRKLLMSRMKERRDAQRAEKGK